jgi:hypothetical protein
MNQIQIYYFSEFYLIKNHLLKITILIYFLLYHLNKKVYFKIFVLDHLFIKVEILKILILFKDILFLKILIKILNFKI